MDMEELWSKTREVLRAEVNAVVYNSLLGSNNLVPALLDGDTLVLRVVMDNLKLLITNQWYSTIVRALSQVAGHQMDVEILTQEEIEARPQLKQKAVEEQETVLESSVALNPKYTFETFVVGSGNRFAHAAALSVATDPAHSYNPLFIYGGAGLGKTHLMHSIAHFIQSTHPALKVLYVSSETFTNELIEAIRNGNNMAMSRFREKYRSMDVLLIDDVQFIIGKESTQEEFFHTFNHLHNAGKQIVISSDKPPKDMTTLEARLRTRFEWGLIADISVPDYETRMAILYKKIELDQLERYQIPDEVIQYIAMNIKTNIRELEGSLNKLIALYRIGGRKNFDVSLAAEALKDMIAPDDSHKVTPELVLDVVSDHFNVSVSELKGSRRNARTAGARQIVMYLCRQMTDASLQSIGDLLGGRDHSTVNHGVDKIARDVEKDETLRNTIEIIQKKISPL